MQKKEGISVRKPYSRMFFVICAMLMVLSAGAGATLAYLTDDAQAENVITIGDVSIDLTEPAWDPASGKNLVPDAAVPKNPRVTNTGSLDAWVFLRVSIPVKNISAVDADTKRKLPAADMELFRFEADSNWELVSENRTASAADYVYGYRTTVAPGSSTTEFFREVSLVNYLEGELNPEEQFTIPVEAVAIQWNAERAEAGLKKIYEECLKQEESNAKEGI